jgi:hypothetical protein
MSRFKNVLAFTPFKVLALAPEPPPATAVSPVGSFAVGCRGLVVVVVPGAEMSLIASQPHVE